jgi:hypothetical protein
MRRFPYLLRLTLTVIILASAMGHDLAAKPKTTPTRVVVPFDFSRINKEMTEEFRKAWRIAKVGTSDYEGVVLLYLLPDGSYKVTALNPSNEFKKFTFPWDDRIVAIFHTHPQDVDPKPAPEDIRIADKYQVLMFTLTLRGMYVYDPVTRKISNVMIGLDWLDESKWTDKVALRMANLSPSFASKLVVNGSR